MPWLGILDPGVLWAYHSPAEGNPQQSDSSFSGSWLHTDLSQQGKVPARTRNLPRRPGRWSGSAGCSIPARVTDVVGVLGWRYLSQQGKALARTRNLPRPGVYLTNHQHCPILLKSIAYCVARPCHTSSMATVSRLVSAAFQRIFQHFRFARYTLPTPRRGVVAARDDDRAARAVRFPYGSPTPWASLYAIQ